MHQSSSTDGIVIGIWDVERRALARQRVLRGHETERLPDDVAEDREEREVLSLLADRFRTPFFRRISAGVGQPERHDGGGERGRRSADVESRVGRDGRPRDDVPPSKPFCPDNGALLRQGSGGQADADRHGHPGQVLLQYDRPHELPCALDGRRILRRRRRVDDRWHLLRLREERRSHNDVVGQKCRERGDDDADGKRRAGSPHREPVARGPHTEHDSDHHQQHADDRGPWRVVGVGHIDAHRRDGQAEGEKDECFHVRSVTEVRPRSPHQTVSGR